MAVPASLALPLSGAALAYLNARWRLPEDRRILAAVISGTRAFKKQLKNDRVNSFYNLEEQAQNPRIADKLFIIYYNQSYTFRQTYNLVLRYAGWLSKTHNVAQGEFVAINMINCPQMLFMIMAVWSLGATPALINYNLVGEPFVHSVRTSTARLLIIEPEVEATVLTPETRSIITAPNFRNNAFPTEVAVLTQGLQSSLSYFPPYRAPDSARSGAIGRTPQVLISTSGTTGLPKAAAVPFERSNVASRAIGKWLGLRPVTSSNPDRYYTAMPIYHATAFQLAFHTCLTHATTLVLSRKFSVSQFWKEVADSNTTAIQYVGETLRYLLAAPPASDDKTKHNLRLAFGNGLRGDVFDKFRNRFGVDTIAEFYGATEGVGGTFNFSRNSFSSGAIGSAGVIIDLVSKSTSKIVQVDWDTEEPYRDPATGFCVRMPTNQPGELLMAVDANDIKNTYQGYHGNEEQTNKKIIHNVMKKGDAYFRTGDAVRRDTEGRLFFTDRLGDTFRWKSENVSTAEVGQVLGYHPKVHEANVYGVSLPGHEGRAGCAAVMLDDSCYTNGKGSDLTDEMLEGLAVQCQRNLPRYAVPVYIRAVKELVVTGTNKQQKPLLRKQGVDPSLTGSDKVYWLRPGSTKYEPFTLQHWEMLGAGKVKL